MSRIKTKFTGVYYRETTTNDKPDKVYYITYKDINNKMKELKIGKFSEGVREVYCNQKRNEIITKLRLGEEPPAVAKHKKKQKTILDDIAKLYFDNRKEGNSKNIDFQNYNKHLKDYFDDIELVRLEDIIKLKNVLKKKKNRKENFLSDKTVNNILTLLISICNFGIKNDLLSNNVSKYVEKFSIDNARDRFLSLEEVAELFEYVHNDHKLWLMCKLFLTTGGRLSTILYISKKDIDFKNMMITLKDFKNNTTYKGFLTEELKTYLQDYCVNLDLNEKLFKSNPEKRLRAILNTLFNEGIESDDTKNKVVIHTFRHTFASHLAINGTPIYTIQKLMNHKDITMTLRYAKLAPDSGRDSVSGLKF